MSNPHYALYPITPPRATGELQVSKLHTLFFACYGNSSGLPAVVLHGGPGAGCNDGITQFFDLKKWNVIMFDQRGAYRSKPFGCMEENTPHHSVDDIEVLRKHLGIDKWIVFGGSWGSALALLYGQAHPEQCLGFILRGIFLAREQDYMHLLTEMGKIFPETYEPFVHHIPEKERGDLLTSYYKRVMDPDPSIHRSAAEAFMRYDLTASTLLPNPAQVEKFLKDDALILGIARAFFYYAKHQFFLKPNQILSAIPIIEHLPAVIVHGRYDMICPVQQAYLLHERWEKSTLQIVPDGGHSANDPPISQALTAATNKIAQVR